MRPPFSSAQIPCFSLMVAVLLASLGCDRNEQTNSTPVRQQAVFTGGSTGIIAPSEVGNLLTAINQARAARGLPALVTDATVQSVAATYAQELAVAHPSPITPPPVQLRCELSGC